MPQPVIPPTTVPQPALSLSSSSWILQLTFVRCHPPHSVIQNPNIHSEEEEDVEDHNHLIDDEHDLGAFTTAVHKNTNDDNNDSNNNNNNNSDHSIDTDSKDRNQYFQNRVASFLRYFEGTMKAKQRNSPEDRNDEVDDDLNDQNESSCDDDTIRTDAVCETPQQYYQSSSKYLHHHHRR
jgi:hypothetical protein